MASKTLDCMASAYPSNFSSHLVHCIHTWFYPFFVPGLVPSWGFFMFCFSDVLFFSIVAFKISFSPFGFWVLLLFVFLLLGAHLVSLIFKLILLPNLGNFFFCLLFFRNFVCPFFFFCPFCITITHMLGCLIFLHRPLKLHSLFYPCSLDWLISIVLSSCMQWFLLLSQLCFSVNLVNFFSFWLWRYSALDFPLFFSQNFYFLANIPYFCPKSTLFSFNF